MGANLFSKEQILIHQYLIEQHRFLFFGKSKFRISNAKSRISYPIIYFCLLNACLLIYFQCLFSVHLCYVLYFALVWCKNKFNSIQLLLQCIFVVAPAVFSGEYCQYESFKPSCSTGRAILMTSAFYGRMRVGRCLAGFVDMSLGANKEDPRYLGCSADVLDVMDAACSGKSDCLVRVPDPKLSVGSPCFKELIMYLEASYTCVNGRTELTSINPLIFIFFILKFNPSNSKCSIIFTRMYSLISKVRIVHNVQSNFSKLYFPTIYINLYVCSSPSYSFIKTKDCFETKFFPL